MKEYFTKQKVKLSDMFKSKHKMAEAVLGFLKKESNSLALTLFIMSNWGVLLALGTDSTLTKLAILVILMITWGEFIFSWKRKLDQQ